MCVELKKAERKNPVHVATLISYCTVKTTSWSPCL